MKTPDEIKMGLIHCTQADEDCNGCPYDPLCFRGDLMILEKHALAYIQQLEKMLGESFARNAPALEAAYGLAEKAKKLESQVPKWISVEERLPEGFATVLIMRDDIKQACVGWLIDGHWSVPKGVRVTHWMPLPEPPVEE